MMANILSKIEFMLFIHYDNCHFTQIFTKYQTYATMNVYRNAHNGIVDIQCSFISM